MQRRLPVNICWLGHASFVIDEDVVIYVDPYRLEGRSGLKPADIILITHSHFDHCSKKDIDKIRKKDTVIIAPADCKPEIEGQVSALEPGKRKEIKGVSIEAVPAYNIGKEFHPREKGWVGYIMTIKGTRIYHAGDTDLIPEMESIEADIALLPVGGTYTMDAEQAADAAKKIKPMIAIPMHYGSVVGRISDADEFEELCESKVCRLDE